MNKFSTLSVIDVVPFGNEQAGSFFALRLTRPNWTGFKAGQFAMVRPVGWAMDLPWARPLSICRLTANELVFFFQVVGRGTERMKLLKSGDPVHVWGPLGSSFAVEEDVPTLILAGGIGLIPFAAYVENHQRPMNLKMLFSHRVDASSYPLDSFNMRVKMESYHEKSLEDRNKFLALVKEQMEINASQKGLILACGPTPFLKYVQSASAELGARTQLSLENRMACGVGACLGCVVTPTEQNPVSTELPQRACVNGPVFWANHIVLGE